jgi:ABC-type lipoprotein release transport system permease subunit
MPTANLFNFTEVIVVVIGLAAGVLPARRAVLLNSVEALRSREIY